MITHVYFLLFLKYKNKIYAEIQIQGNQHFYGDK